MLSEVTSVACSFKTDYYSQLQIIQIIICMKKTAFNKQDK